jgi:hypothetical protein
MSTWRLVGRGWRVYLPVTVVLAAIQVLLVSGDPAPAFTWSFVALFFVSLVAVFLAVWLTLRTATGAAGSRLSSLGWLAGAGLLALVTAVVEPLLLPVALALGLLVLPPAAAGDGNPIAAGWRSLRRAPWRYVLAFVVLLALAGLSWVVALLLGLFVTGVLSAGLSWLWFGGVMTLIICQWCAVYAGATSRAGVH